MGESECLRTAIQTLETEGGKPQKRRTMNLSGADLQDRFKPDRKDIRNYQRKYWIVVDI